MLKRAWYVIAGMWALACILPDMANPSPKLFIVAFMPFAAGWLLARATRFVVTGSPVKPARAVPYRGAGGVPPFRR